MKLYFETLSNKKGCIESDNIKMCKKLKKEWMFENKEKEKVDKK